MNLRHFMRTELAVGSVITYPLIAEMHPDAHPAAIKSAIATLVAEEFLDPLTPKSNPMKYRVIASLSSPEKIRPQSNSISQRDALRMFSTRCARA